MKKTLLLGVGLFLILISCGCNKEPKIKEEDVVTFKDTSLNISANDLYQTLKEKYGTSFLIDMMDRKILDKEYETNEETEEYVDIQVNTLKNYYKTESEFLEYINNYGYKNEQELREYFQLNYKRNLAVYDYLESLISENDINEYYEQNVNGDITGSHILINVNITDSMTEDEKRTAKEESLNKAKEAITKLDNGTSFADVAKEYSEDSATKNKGGSMGTFNSLDLDDVTRQEYSKLAKGEYSKTPVETEYGYEVFFKEDEKEKPSLDSVKSRIIKIISDEKLNNDSKLQYKGIIAMRQKYGFTINDEDLAVYYENTMNNLLKSE